MEIETVRGYFNDKSTVQHYVRAVANVGLWASEASVFQKRFDKRAKILDLGCGAGRVAIGLWKLGYRALHGADLAENMVIEATDISRAIGARIPFVKQDATEMSFSSDAFDGVIFAFNGLMQIPGQSSRLKALREIARILKPGGTLVFTSLDRSSPLYRSIFADPSNPEHDLLQNSNLVDFGDRHFETSHGTTYMHVPERSEVLGLVTEAGFHLIEDRMRSEIEYEDFEVRDFSEDCRFWVLRKVG